MNNNDNNNNLFNGVDGFNNNSNTTSQTPTTPINNGLNSSMQSQVNNGAMLANNSFDGQFNSQSNNNGLSSINFSEASNVVQPKVDTVPQQPSVNQINNNLSAQSNNTPDTPSTQQQNSFQNNNVGTTSQNSFQSTNLNSMQSQTSNGVMSTNNSFNGQFSGQTNSSILSNTNVLAASNVVQPKVDNVSQQPIVNQINNDLATQNNNKPSAAMPQQNAGINSVQQNSFQANNVGTTSQNNFQSSNANSIPQQATTFTTQAPTNNTSVNDEELLRAFIGNNYDKITTRPFNFAGFFFTTFYMFYRKMFLYGILLFLVNLVVLNIINNFIITLIFCLIVGFFVNKIYLYYANKKIAKIKFQNQGKTIDELKRICSSKGGTSVGKIFLGFLAELAITFVVLIVMFIAGIGGFIGNIFNLDNWNTTMNGNENDMKNGTLVEDVIVSGYSCVGSKCSVSIEDSNNMNNYAFSGDNIELFKILGDYSDYIKLNIYYTQKGEEKSIVDYEVFLKSNNENISNVKTEDELRNKIGLYSIGIHTDSFTLAKIGMTGAGFKDDMAYTYTNYIFVDSKNNEYEMKYINSNGTLNLVEGNKYSVTFEVAEDTFGYEFYIKNIN